MIRFIVYFKQGQSYVSNKQTALEDRYYNNQSFQNEYPVNDPDVNNAATKIQAQFRGHKARRDIEKLKQQESDYDYGQSTILNDEYRRSSPLASACLQQQENKYDENVHDKQQFEEDLTEEEKHEQERAAISIQANFRGYQVRKNLRESFDNINEQEQNFYQQQQQEYDNNYNKIPTSTRFSDRHDLGGNLTTNDDIEAGKNDDIDRSRLEREPIQLSEDFERHTQIPRDSNFAREQQEEIFNDEDDMNNSTLDQAATRIQASYRGYKTRKELGSVSGHSHTGHDQHHSSLISSQTHDEYNNTRNKNILSPSAQGNKVLANEDDDNAAAVKIQAAYRGYRVRKDLEK